MICIGYIGWEAYDIILYMGRTLTKLKYRVLIIDLSNSDALMNSIRNSMELNSTEEIINYRDLNYIRRIPTKEEAELFGNCVALIAYGSNYLEEGQFEFKMINIVVNSFPHIIQSINKLLQKAEFQDKNVRLLVRDIIRLDDVDHVLGMVSSPVIFHKVNYLYLEINDYENAIECQRTQKIKFSRMSLPMEKYIIDQIHDLLPQLSQKRIRRALIIARKGV